MATAPTEIKVTSEIAAEHGLTVEEYRAGEADPGTRAKHYRIGGFLCDGGANTAPINPAKCT